MTNNQVLKNFTIITFICVFCCINGFAQAPTVTYNPPTPYLVGNTISPLKPTSTGTGIKYSVSPDLPLGLTLESGTGIINGSPQKPYAEATYTITAANGTSPNGTFPLKITVKQAPPGITYKSSNIFTVGIPITQIDPSTDGGPATKYTMSPTLPAGLAFNTTTGAITGTPTAAAAADDYTVTATNDAGNSAPSKIKITVNPAPAPDRCIACISLIGIFLICAGIIGFLIYLIQQLKRNQKQALGLPSGSVRAIIAILFVVFFMLLAVIFYFDSDTTVHNTDLSKQIITILGTLVTAVSGFYFGSKTSEQAHANAAAALQNQQPNQGDVPINIIQEAIQANKAAWMNTYGCQDIVAGKKTSQNTTQNLNCIAFIVVSKDNLTGKTAIPPTISYVSGGTTYNIPTDVQAQQVKIVLTLDSSVLATTATADMLKNAKVNLTLSGAVAPISAQQLPTDPNGTFTATIVTAGNYTIAASLPVAPAGGIPGTLTNGTPPPSMQLQPGAGPINLIMK